MEDEVVRASATESVDDVVEVLEATELLVDVQSSLFTRQNSLLHEQIQVKQQMLPGFKNAHENDLPDGIRVIVIGPAEA